MIGFLVRKIFGSKNDRFLKKLRPLVAKINALEPEMQALADEELPQRLAVYREQVQNGEKDLDAVLPEVFALVREASTRVLGMRHYDVQLLGAMALHNGKIAEMKTGEGKTLVATLAVILNSLEARASTSLPSTTTSPSVTPNGWAGCTTSSAFPWASSSRA